MGNFCSDCFKNVSGSTSSGQYETIHSEVVDFPEPVHNPETSSPPKVD